MNISEIKRLIKIVESSDIGEIEIIEEGRKIRISKNSKLVAPMVEVNGTRAVPMAAQAGPGAPALASNNQGQAVEAEAKPEAEPQHKYHEVRAPMVGTFYRAPAPNAAPYVEVGDHVEPGQTLCIIEAMKLMNEIQSEVRGRVAKILVENAQPVEYNQVLFLIEEE
ncbi:MAG: acetyl-CoA carboxylase biotin carboxyl carrier protein [Calditrichaeota bacterium]|nr:MAG: acetyl-CoA carboxylase biotin carboxyl carrier protein [Calditrichota bacterium]